MNKKKLNNIQQTLTELQSDITEVNQINQSVVNLSCKLEELTKLFQTKMQYDSSKDKMIDKLHAELQKYKDGLVFQILRPIVMNIIHLHDDMGKMIRDCQAQKKKNNELVECLLNYQESIEDLLYDYGFEVYETEGDMVNPKRQHILKTIPTSIPELSRTVKERFRKGFQYEDIIIRKEFVSTFLFNNQDE